MVPKRVQNRQGEIFGIELERLVDAEHPLVRVSKRLEWKNFEERFGQHFSPELGRPGIPTRLMVGLHYLKYSFDLSDEAVVERWVENPYWQYLCGERYFRHEFPIHPTSMTKWRKKVGVEGAEAMLRETIELALRCHVVKESEFRAVNVDTTVQEKAIAFPTDAKLYHRMRVTLVKLASQHDVSLRQSYTRLGRRALIMSSRYFAARQTRRGRKMLRKVRGYLGRVVRDIERKIAENSELKGLFSEQLALAHRLLNQKKTDTNKLYSIHAPEVECIAKGKAHKKYEFGVKVSVATTSRSGLVLAASAVHGNPYDGHTLTQTLNDVARISGREIVGDVYVDRGYRGHEHHAPATVHIAGKKKLSPRQRRAMRRRSAIEAKISNLKFLSRMDRNFLLGVSGDKINALLCAASVNLRLVLRALALFFRFLLELFRAASPKIVFAQL